MTAKLKTFAACVLLGAPLAAIVAALWAMIVRLTLGG